MNNVQNGLPAAPGQRDDAAGGGLADSSLNEAPAPPNGPPAQDEGRHRIPGNDQREGLEEAEKAGKNPAKPGPRP